jgi:hypothetical protein
MALRGLGYPPLVVDLFCCPSPTPTMTACLPSSPGRLQWRPGEIRLVGLRYRKPICHSLGQ